MSVSSASAVAVMTDVSVPVRLLPVPAQPATTILPSTPSPNAKTRALPLLPVPPALPLPAPALMTTAILTPAFLMTNSANRTTITNHVPATSSNLAIMILLIRNVFPPKKNVKKKVISTTVKTAKS